MRQRLELPPNWDGNLWHYRQHGRNVRHRHAELEFNLITQGAGLYLLANRKYQIRRGDLLWLFPAQEHILIGQTPDFEMWIGVFKPAAVRRIATDVPVRDVHPAVERAARLIRNEDTTLNLDELARRSGLSAPRLSRLFKQQTGVALVDFRNRQRVERFLQLYGTGQRLTMLDAALDAGFGSYPQFHRVFKRVIGCSPGRYRRR
jgi:AraC-like DNA-binding protein